MCIYTINPFISNTSTIGKMHESDAHGGSPSVGTSSNNNNNNTTASSESYPHDGIANGGRNSNERSGANSSGDRFDRDRNDRDRNDRNDRSNSQDDEETQRLNKLANTAPPSRVLGVFGLNPRTTESDLDQVFSKYGKLEKVNLIRDRQTRSSRCYAFIYFDNKEDAVSAKEGSLSLELDGRVIRIDYSASQKPHDPTPGRYFGTPSRYSPYKRYDDRGGYNRGGDRGGDRGYDRYDRDRSRDRGYDRYDRDRSRDRDYDRDRGYDRDRSRDRGGDRGGDRDRGYDRDRSRDRGYDRDNSRDRYR
ncbi:RNA-binding region RNP-1 domain-containing protein [Cavenderia fasciculata]|uniref:RNA-binding region RNP-1 domain-containing protein n=1 Tax=Cavenderia fasciculata TaxID=261658 RepID=F4PNR4_CACFS|nr:RNA-binding region RNP-1 domain-containing protein [Cavenderia fasciculata]EGG23117.1 RNA-binding region RNP-1 domain-containing protein [Cavenderia fasciculata]|eukprot:XP_004360968.1 RNA-binding region RNP-1 domain-containing protein [Cavenderia fasciculata]